MKVVILNNYGGSIPKFIKSYVNAGNEWRWGKVIKFIETNAINASDLPLKDIKVNVVCYPGVDKNSRTYLFKEEIIILSIVDVDTTRPWTISIYDGAEYVQYLDYEYVVKSINFCELPRS